MSVRLLVPGAALALAATAAPASATQYVTPGGPCRVTATSDPTDPTLQVGTLDFGPVTAQQVDPGSSPTAGLNLMCGIQVGVSYWQTAAPYAAHGIGVVAPEAHRVSFHASPTDDVYACAAAFFDGSPTVYYYDGGTWTTTSAPGSCTLTIAFG